MAFLRYSASDLESRFQIVFIDGEEDGLGRTKSAGFRTANGRQFSLIQYLDAPVGPATAILCLHDEHVSDHFNDILELLGMDLSDLATYESQLCISSNVILAPHALHRQDEHGTKATIAIFQCRADATKHLRQYESSGHKQTYWITPAGTS